MVPLLAFTLFSTLCLTLCLVPYLGKTAQTHGLVDRPNTRKIHQRAVPRIGGVAIFISFYCTLVIDYFLFRPEFDLYVFDHTYVFFVLGSLVAFGVGLADDFTGLRARRKLCFQIVAAGMAYTLVLDGRLPVGRRAEILLQAERATRQALLREPAEPRAWARLAWFLHIRQGAAVQFLAALRMSMYLAPADTDLAFWRIKMAGPCRADWDAGFEQMLTRQVILGWRVYLRVADRDMVALLDVGEVGPDYLPGHAHADTLSFEMSVFGQRVVVNSGTSCYGLGAERSRQRGTSAHSTVEVNGMDSSEVWGGFRVGRRARPFDVVVEETGRGVEVACSHDGYRRLPGQPVHRRADGRRRR